MKAKISFISRSVLVALFIMLGYANNASAQEEREFRTLFDQLGPIKVSGFGAPILEFSAVQNEFAVFNGGGGAVLINQFFIGGYGMGLSTNHYRKINVYQETTGNYYNYSDDRINFGHGGFWLGGIFHPADAIHLAASTKLGWGGISLYEQNQSWELRRYEIIDNVFVIQPQVEMEMNITRWFKLNVGVGYRLVSGIDKTYPVYDNNFVRIGEEPYFGKSDFNGFSGTVSFLFGGFN